MDPQVHPAAAAARPPEPLSPSQWSVLILRDVLGWPAADVATLLGTSVSASGAALRQARAGVRGTPGQAELAALARLVGSTDRAVLSLTGALLREHAPPPARRIA